MNPELIQKAVGGNIITDLGLESLPEAEKLRLIQSLTDLTGQRLVARIIERLSAEDRTTFELMIESSNPESMFPWLEERGIIFEEFLLEEVARIREELKARYASV